MQCLPKEKKHKKAWIIVWEEGWNQYFEKVLCVYYIGPYTVTKNKKQQLSLQWCTTIDPATDWAEVAEVKTMPAYTIINQVDQTWLGGAILPMCPNVTMETYLTFVYVMLQKCWLVIDSVVGMNVQNANAMLFSKRISVWVWYQWRSH